MEPAHLQMDCEPSSRSEAGPKHRILIVDDISNNRDILVRRLQRRGFETVEASDGWEALRLIETGSFAAVLLDIMMPHISGLEVLRRVREHYPADVLPVIMVTGKSLSEDVVDALSLGANDYVTKPIDFPVVLARLTSQIERRRKALALAGTNDVLRNRNEDLQLTLSERNVRLQEANERLRGEISRRLEADSRSSYLAYHDALTGLANRHSCDERLPEMLRSLAVEGGGLAALFLDLDGFKNVNDAFGHAVGDALIKDVAGTMEAVVGEEDFLVRLGGDEFCVLHVSGDAQASAPRLAQTLIDAIGVDRTIDGLPVFIQVSIGVAFAGDPDAVDATELLRRADLAMYQAKADGRGLWQCYDPEMDAVIQDRCAIEHDLREALGRGEFEIFFQPIVSLASDRIAGFEALLRWDRQSRGFVSPDKFIPIAEESGLIVGIGDWVLRRACEEAATWPDDLRIAVNVSPVQFRGKHLLASVVGTLAATGLEPARLELEITETALLRNTHETLCILTELREIGVRLSMDDFGTGYSSLGYFRSFQFDKVKIDRSFVSGAMNNCDGKAIVRAVVGLGESLGMTTIAEGVETEEQLAHLRDEGCQEVQGFLFGAAQPATRTRDLIRAVTSQAAADPNAPNSHLPLS